LKTAMHIGVIEIAFLAGSGISVGLLFFLCLWSKLMVGIASGSKRFVTTMVGALIAIIGPQ
jgi:hypothetical protein